MSTTPTPMPDSQAPVNQPGMGTKILGALSGGGKDTNYNVGDDGIMKAVQTPQAPGQMFKNLLGGMLTGLAGGVQANAEGMGGGLGAFAGGFQAQQAKAQQQDAMKRQQAEQNFKNQQTASETKTRAMVAQGEMAKSQLEQAKFSFELARDRRQLSEEEQDKHNAYNNAVKNTPGAKFDGSYDNFDNFLKSKSPEEQKAIIASKARGEVQTLNTYDEETGRVTGVQVYEIPQTWLQKPMDKDGVLVHDEADPKTGKVKSVNTPIPAGSMTNAQYLDAQSKNLRPLASLQGKQEADQTKITIEDKRDATKLQTDAADNATKLGVARINANAGMMSLTDGTTLNLNGADGQQATAAAAMDKGIEAAAWTFIESGGKTLPSMGFGKQGNADKRKVLARAGLLMTQNGIDPSDLGAIGANIGANKSALVKITQSQAQMKVFEDTLDNNMKTADALNKKYSRTNMSFANRVIEHIRKGTGDPEVAQWVLQMGAIAPEFGKIMQGATSSAGGTVSGTEDAKKLIDRQLASGQIDGIFGLMRKDMKNRNDAANNEKKELLTGTRGEGQNEAVTGGQPQQSSNAPAGTVGYTSNGTTYHIPKDKVKEFLKDHPKASTI